MNPRRVVYFNYEWDVRASSGAGTHLAEVTHGLRALGHTVAAYDRHRAPATAAPAPKAAPSLRRRAREGLSPWLHESAALLRAARGVSTETAILRRERPDVVLTRHCLHPFSSLVAARRCRLPIVFEVNAPLAHEYRRYHREFRLVPGLAEWTEAATLAAADAVTTVSSVLRADLIARGVPADRITVNPNGADTAVFRPDATDRELRNRLGQERILVGFIGSFASFHGIAMLREAIAHVLPARPRATFVMVGAGRLSGELEEYCRARGWAERVHFTGFVPRDRVPGLAAAMDVLLAPYPPNDFFYFSPIKLFEYMASGRAVLAARVGQIAEVVEDGVNGLLHEPGDASDLATKLLALVDDASLRARLGRAARRSVEREYSWRANATRLGAVLARAATRPEAAWGTSRVPARSEATR